MNTRKKAESTWIHTIVSLVIAGLGILVLFLVLSGQFSILYGSSRAEEAARAGFQTFVLDINEFANTPEDHAVKRYLELTSAGGDTYPVIFFPKKEDFVHVFSGKFGERDLTGTSDEFIIEEYGGTKKGAIVLPQECGEEQCLCILKREKLWRNVIIKIAREQVETILDCAPVTSDIILAYLPPQNLVEETHTPLRGADVRQYSIPKPYFQEYANLLDDPLIPESTQERNDKAIYVDFTPRFFTSTAFYTEALTTSPGEDFYVGDSYYAEKRSSGGKTLILLVPENSYAKDRAKAFDEEYTSPELVLGKYITNANVAEGTHNDITTYATRKLSELINNAKTANDAEKLKKIELLKTFTNKYFEYLKNNEEERFQTVYTEGGRRRGIAIHVGATLQLLEQLPEEQLVHHAATDTLKQLLNNNLYAYTLNKDGSLKEAHIDVELQKAELYTKSIAATRTLTPASYELLKTIVENPELWTEEARERRYQGDTQLREVYKTLKERYPPLDTSLLHNHLITLSTTQGTMRQEAIYLLAKFYTLYDTTIDGVTKKWKGKAITAYKDAIALNPSSSIAGEAQKEKAALCADTTLSQEDKALCTIETQQGATTNAQS